MWRLRLGVLASPRRPKARPLETWRLPHPHRPAMCLRGCGRGGAVFCALFRRHPPAASQCYSPPLFDSLIAPPQGHTEAVEGRGGLSERGATGYFLRPWALVRILFAAR
jgi:hypothetical protein